MRMIELFWGLNEADIPEIKPVIPLPSPADNMPDTMMQKLNKIDGLNYLNNGGDTWPSFQNMLPKTSANTAPNPTQNMASNTTSSPMTTPSSGPNTNPSDNPQNLV